MAFVDTLVKRAANRPARSIGSLSMMGLYDSEKKTFSVILCPDAPEHEGQTYPIASSMIDSGNAAEYARTSGADMVTAIDRMDRACNMAKASDLKSPPPMLYMLPSVNVFNGVIKVHRTGYSCRSPLLEGAENNIRYPVGCYAPVDACVFTVLLSQQSSKGRIYDAVNFFVNKRGATVHEGRLNDENFGNTLAGEVSRSPLLDSFVGEKAAEFREKGNAFFDHASTNEAVKYAICPVGHPETVLYGSIVSLYQKNWETPGNAILAEIRRDIARRIFNGDEQCREFGLLMEKTMIRCVTGFIVHEVLTDMSEKNPEWPNNRILAPLADRCCQISRKGDKVFCLPPGAAPAIDVDGVKKREVRHLLQTLRSMVLRIPTGGTCFPQGSGLLVIQIRKDKESGEFRYIPTLAGGMLSRQAAELTTRYQFPGVKFDLSENGIPLEALPKLMERSPDEMLVEAQKISESLDDPESLRTMMTEDNSVQPDPVDVEQAKDISEKVDMEDEPVEGDNIPF